MLSNASVLISLPLFLRRSPLPTQFLSRPDLFKQIHTHTDIRLALGWAGVIIAVATGLYGYKIEFEAAKPVVWMGVSLCALFPLRL
jgi:hypothetical protein